MSVTAYRAAAIHDGMALRRGVVLVVDGPVVRGLAAPGELPEGCEVVETGAEILAPGYVDLQVNGGGGVMLNDGPSPERMEVIARAHAACGTTSILPTLISAGRAATEAAMDAQRRPVRGVIGLHLEGPHLDPVKAGAHSPALIRPMEDEDLERLRAVRGRLKVTLAPATVSLAQVERLAAEGVLVSLGHSACSFEVARDYAAAGARCVTHLFNAMSQMESRAPGLVGAALACGTLSAGLICDGVHVHPEAMRLAARAKQGPGRLFLVSDAMACAGSEIERFTLDGREILRRDGRLTLADGTLAGADLVMAEAVRNAVRLMGLSAEEAIAMATGVPAALVGAGAGRLRAKAPADFIALDAGLRVQRVWQAGSEL
ncbi:N-acetylglucosamine-6-phosphate deacetylase [Vannielia litorea]|uniref:N-acetylglucosamine 6-phosphate deacetylase n=1 Tax=Vannielia litorea TaxID=1217970 RepID=A0A1N6HND7_9RHOB|nr:N-acetylglucosamine-6-phosphate deacetylase [Vannielia litorea]SIO21199.1 N-acetylglucosamine 6-phosphate deacetylase [Vannielia litorea]